MKRLSFVKIDPSSVVLNKETVCQGYSNLTDLYRKALADYPKFFKMDGLCKLGFIAAELLLKEMPADLKENMAIVLFNRAGSLATDRNYQSTLADDNYFPSPAVFVYTLSNIVTGEIAIRHKIYGESSFYILDSYDKPEMLKIVESTLSTSQCPAILTGWVDYENDSDYLAEMELITQ